MRKEKLLMIITAMLIPLTSKVFAADRYWTASGSGNWSDGKNWSETSGGNPCDTLPESGDNIFFDDKGQGVCSVDKTADNIGSITITEGHTGKITQSTNLTVSGDFSHSGAAIWDTAECNLTVGVDFTITNSAVVNTGIKSQFYFYGNYTAKQKSRFTGWHGETVTFCGKGTKTYTQEFPSEGFSFSKVVIGGGEDRRLDISGTMRALSLQVKTGTIGGTGTIVFYNPNKDCYRYSGATWADSVNVCMSAPGKNSTAVVPGGRYPNLFFTACCTYTTSGPIECAQLSIDCQEDNAWTILDTGGLPLTFKDLRLGNKGSKVRQSALDCRESTVKCSGTIYIDDENSCISCGKSTFILTGENTLPSGEVVQPTKFYNLVVSGKTTLSADCIVENDLTVEKGAVLDCAGYKLIVNGTKKVLGELK
ncbi:MAG: hypothetical protein V2A65_09685 [Candidatus Omnitrophota bacterium]